MSEANKSDKPGKNPWWELFETREAIRQMSTVADLEKLAERDATVRHFFRAWRYGAFASFEQCLIALALHLAETNRKLIDAQMRLSMLAGVDFARDLVGAHAAAVGNHVVQKKVDQIVQEMLSHEPPREFSTQGKSIELPGDFVPPIERGEDKPQ
jgi:hypothetical protein